MPGSIELFNNVLAYLPCIAGSGAAQCVVAVAGIRTVARTRVDGTGAEALSHRTATISVATVTGFEFPPKGGYFSVWIRSIRWICAMACALIRATVSG